QVGVEGGPAGVGGRVRAGHHGDALPAGGEQVEPDRPPDVQPDQRQLGWGAVGELPGNPESDPEDALVEGVPLPRSSGYDRISDEVQSNARNQEAGEVETPACATPVELHHLAAQRIEGRLKSLFHAALAAGAASSL